MKKKCNFLVLLILLVSIALYGCSGEKKTEVKEETPNTDDMVSTEPQTGGSVVVGILQDLDSLDPHKAVAAGTKEVLFNVFEGLVKPDKDGNLVPAVASDYEISPDGLVYTFTLREGIKFHNGEAVTVQDIEYSIKRCAGLLDEKDSSVVVDAALSNIKEVNIKDERTVELVLKEANTELLGYLTVAIIPKDYKEQGTKPVGTGPFRFVSYTPLESMIVEKNPEYYVEGKPYLDKVTFKIVANTDAAFMELQAGSIDIFPYLTDSQAKQLEGTMRIEEGHMNLVQALFLNNKVAPFDNIKVRQALNYAIDKQTILDMVAGGKGSIIGTNMFPAYAKYYLEELNDVYPYDPEKAKALLKEAGLPDGFTFAITVPSNYQYHVDTAQVIVEQLKAVGISATINQVEWATWLSEVYTERKYEATIIGLDARLAPRDAMDRYLSTADNNFVNYSNSEYDATLDKAIRTVDENEKVESYQKLQTLLTEDAASVYIQDPPLLVAVNKKLAGYTFYPVYVQDMSVVYFIK
ncbi:peptide/nickel transport system substrate-binding protein [Mobilisporobacter senegalensis]|uniref:Peptide/nickel transport system substrate-binding protein n=1 Tax=Mobilisporobacter senegalensis TaxID=1329262 RepID=A0A3N1XPE9_9FIRM|nr:ABC transporter substrate-binding protein [Mobilisporobacter senegalensis]ROR28559.1 peptide/nickel transport system substrate-binding protein [Mobilisporobacter senegalensis]